MQKTRKSKNKKSSDIKSDFNKNLSKKLKQRFSNIKTKDRGDSIMEISFKKGGK